MEYLISMLHNLVGSNNKFVFRNGMHVVRFNVNITTKSGLIFRQKTVVSEYDPATVVLALELWKSKCKMLILRQCLK